MKIAKLSRLCGEPKDSAQTLVEFAMALPLLALLLFGIIQYGFIFNAYMTLRHGAHQTARTLSLPSANTNSANVLLIAQRAIQPMSSTYLGTPSVTPATVNTANDAVQVQLSYG